MRTLVKAPFAASLRAGRRLGLWTALPLAGLLVAGEAAAQQPQPFGQPQPQPQPFGQPQPQPQPFGQPQPPAGPPPAAAPGAQGNFTFGASAGGQGAQIEGGAAAEAPAATPAEDEAAERELSLIEQNNASGSTGLLRTSYAGSGAPGTFRVSFLSDWFSTSGFLCRPDKTTAAGQSMGCGPNNAEDKASHVGGFFAVNATPLSFLEAYLALRTYANSNDQGRPQLLQVLGDTTLGAKAFLPPKLGRPFTFGGEVQVFMLNGTGGVGPNGGSTSAAFRLLGSADLRKPHGEGIPLRLNLNLGYKVDNSGKLVSDIESARAAAFKDGRDTTPISRIERYGLGINRVDSFQAYLGAVAPFSKVQPFVEYTMDIPVNRQGYQCHTGRVSQGDVCLGLADFSSVNAATPNGSGGPGFAAVPSRFTLGVRTTPFDKGFRGLSATLALDIGVSGNSTFVEEVAPQAPWTLYFGLGYAFDTREKVAPAPPPAPPPAPRIVPAPQNYVRGYVHDAAKADQAVPDAIVSLEGVASQPPVATGADGRFLTRDLVPGTYTFTIKAAGYKPGQCVANVGMAQPQQATPWGAQPGQPWTPGQPQPQPQPWTPGQPQPAPFGQPQPGMPAAPPPAAPQGPTYVDVDCPMQSLPRLGAIVGQVKDPGGAPLAGVVVRATDSNTKSFSATTDGSGSFQLKDVAPGAINVRADKDGFMSHSEQLNAAAGQDTRATIVLNKRPKNANVRVEGKELRVSQQIHFETDSAKILGDSNALIEEIADVLQRNPNIKKVEIQGHTDNAGSREHNQQLSEARASSVRQALINAGVDGGRLVAKGYGQDRPIAPNVTAANRARNRRVQFIILEKQ
jgi:outer membrane protein OmpA-like peptidoglycan-associated protein